MSTYDLLKNMFLCYVEEHITVPLINDHTARKNLSICDDLHLYVTSTPQNDELNRNRNLDCANKTSESSFHTMHLILLSKVMVCFQRQASSENVTIFGMLFQSSILN